METAQLLFRARSSRDAENAVDKVQTYLAALYYNGQIVGDHIPLAKARGGYLAIISLPEAGALAERFGNKWVRRAVRELATAGVHRPRVTHLGAHPEIRPACKCRKRPFLILFTTFLHFGPPVRCGVCFGPIALYRLRATNEAGNYQHVLRWQSTYQAMDRLFIGSGPGERFAHDQLARHDSALSKDGRELARAIEKKVRLPVYYYLSKYFGRSDLMERRRRCPSCGKAWLRPQPRHRIFDFDCRRCRLLSSVAFDVRVDPSTS